MKGKTTTNSTSFLVALLSVNGVCVCVCGGQMVGKGKRERVFYNRFYPKTQNKSITTNHTACFNRTRPITFFVSSRSSPAAHFDCLRSAETAGMGWDHKNRHQRPHHDKLHRSLEAPVPLPFPTDMPRAVLDGLRLCWLCWRNCACCSSSSCMDRAIARASASSSDIPPWTIAICSFVVVLLTALLLLLVPAVCALVAPDRNAENRPVEEETGLVLCRCMAAVATRFRCPAACPWQS